jgi:hypothetical protein
MKREPVAVRPPRVLGALGSASVALVLGAAALRADEVYLKGGGQLSGKIVSRTATTIEVDVGAGKIGVPASSVLRIEEGRSPLHEFEERAGKLAAGDADGWVALGDWARSRGLGTQAREAYHRALAASPLDPRANEALGNVLVDGRWVSEDESYRAKGYVQLEGEWMPPAEAEAIQRERATADEAERRSRDAEARAREAEARAGEAEARAREAEAQQASDGIPLWYAWGGGPVYWPSGPIVNPPNRPAAPSRPVAPPSRPVVRPPGSR